MVRKSTLLVKPRPASQHWLVGFTEVKNRLVTIEDCSPRSGYRVGLQIDPEEYDQSLVVDGLGWAVERGLLLAQPPYPLKPGAAWGALKVVAHVSDSAVCTKAGVTERISGPPEYVMECTCGQMFRIGMDRFPGKRVMRWCLQPNCHLAETMEARVKSKQDALAGLVERPPVKKLGRPPMYRSKDGRKRKFGLYLEEGMMGRLEKVAGKRGMSMSHVVTGLIELWLVENQEKGADNNG
jgi:hypothetical protein